MTIAPCSPGRCVFVANRLPFPISDGWGRRTFHVIRELAREWPVTLVVLSDDPESVRSEAERAFGTGVRIITTPRPRWRLLVGALRSLFRGTSIHEAANRTRALEALLRREADQHDVAIWACAGTYMAGLLPQDSPRAIRLIDTHNIDSLAITRYVSVTRNPIRRWFFSLTARRLQALEAREFGFADIVVVCSDDEVSLVRQAAPRSHCVVAPNGVDLEQFTAARDSTPDPFSLLFFGRLDYLPNIDAIQFLVSEIFPRIRAIEPRAKLRIAGAGRTDEIMSLLRGTNAIEFLGEIPDVNVILQRAAVTVAPIRVGGGTRLKILEALAAGRPVVATTVGAEGIEITSGRDAMICDSANDIAVAVVAIMRDPKLALRLSVNGRALAEATYAWPRIGENLRNSVSTAWRSRFSSTAPPQ